MADPRIIHRRLATPHPKPKGGGSENSKFTTEEAKLASGARAITTAPA